MRPQDFRLSARITAAALFIVVAGVVVWVWAGNARSRDAYLREQRIVLEASLRAETGRLNRAVEVLREDALFLAATPSVTDVLRAQGEERMQGMFVAFAKTHTDYYRISYVDADGRERVRVDNAGGTVSAAARGVLADRSGADYFAAALALREGQAWLSGLAPAADPGEAHAYRMNAVAPVFSAPGKRKGMVVVGMDAGQLLKPSRVRPPPGVFAVVADADGHPLFNVGLTHASAAGSGRDLTGDFASLGRRLASQAGDLLPLQLAETQAGGQYLAAGRIRFDPDHRERFLMLVYGLPEADVARRVAAIPVTYIAGGFVFILLAGSIAWLALRRTSGPLAKSTEAAERIIAGDRSVQLPQQEDKFRKELAESLPGVFYMIDASGRFIMWNHNLQKALHCSAEEIAAAHPLDFFEGEDAHRIRMAIGQVFESGEVALEAVLVARNGSRIPYHFTGRRVSRNGEPVLVGLGVDMTGQHKSMREATRLLQRNQVLMQNSMEGIHVLDTNGDVVDVNEAFCRMLGYTREEALRLNLIDWDHRFSPEEFRARLKQIAGGSSTFEIMHWRKDGTPLNVELCTTGVEIDGKHYVFAASRDITERKKAEAALQMSEANLRAMLDNSPYLTWLKDAEGRYIMINKVFADFLRLADARDIVGKTDLDMQPREMAEKYRADDAEVMTTRCRKYVEELASKAGENIWMETYKTPIIDANGDVLGTVGFACDITARKKFEAELRVAAVAFETHDAILITDSDSNIVRVNQAFTEITGYRPEEVLGQNPRIMRSGQHDRAFYIEMWQQLLHSGSWSGEIWDRRKSGEIYPKWMTISAVRNEQHEITHYVAIFSDITVRKQAEEEIRNLAFYDALTRLPNRRLFMDRFRSALSISARRNSYGAVLFIDLDHFKVLNDTLGHVYGDLLLVEVAGRIKTCVREMDTVARLGGDEFVVLIEDIDGNQDEASRKVGLIADKIREALAHSYNLRDREHHSSPSIGISLYRGNETSVDEVLQRADMAMYQAKGAGRNATRFFDPVMQRNVTMRAALEHDLRHAVSHGELQLYYQVQVDADHRPTGAEALLRWLHPQRGLILPGQFIPIAEESALILDVGRWVLDRACHQLALWGQDERTRNLALAVNVSARQFAQPDFVDQVAAATEMHGIVTANNLKLELTESLVLQDLKSTASKMHDLKMLGVQLSMDDFGTGYSSLSYLQQLPLDQIKIDQGFVQGITRDGNDALLVRTIIDLARNFRLSVIAEGVETEAQLAFLKQQGCMAYQGYLFGRPLPVKEFEELLRRLL